MDVTEIGRRSPGPVTIEVLGTGMNDRKHEYRVKGAVKLPAGSQGYGAQRRRRVTYCVTEKPRVALYNNRTCSSKARCQTQSPPCCAAQQSNRATCASPVQSKGRKLRSKSLYFVSCVSDACAQGAFVL